MSVVSLALLVAVVAVAATAAVRALRSFIKFRAMEMAIPGPPSKLILGNLMDVIGAGEEEVFNRVMCFWGGRTKMSRVSVLQKLILFINNPEEMTLAIKKREFSDKSHTFYDFIAEMARFGLIQSNGPIWKAHRQAIQPAFHGEVLDPYAELFAEEAENYVTRQVRGKEVDVRDNLHYALSRGFMRTTMVSDVSKEDEEALLSLIRWVELFLRSLNERSFKPWLWPGVTYRMTTVGRQILAEYKDCNVYLRTLIARRKAALRDGYQQTDFISRKKTLVDVLIADNSKYIMQEEEIVDELLTFLGAAVETSTSALSFAFKVLSIYPDIQERVHAEVVEVLGSKDGKVRSVTLQDLHKFVYLEQVVKETLRLLPAIPFVGRDAKEDTEFQGKQVAAGTTVVINIYAIHRDPNHWPDPLKFDPDRFSPERSAGRHPHAFVPFSAGPRNCIGYRYAMMNIKTLLATTIRDFRIDAIDDGITDPLQLPLTFDLSLRVLGGTKVKFTPREGVAAPSQARVQG